MAKDEWELPSDDDVEASLSSEEKAKWEKFVQDMKAARAADEAAGDAEDDLSGLPELDDDADVLAEGIQKPG